MNDSVREELQDKISSPSRRLHMEMVEELDNVIEETAAPSGVAEANVFPAASNLAHAAEEIESPQETERNGFTTELRGAARTSRTLVGFQNKNNALPEWRLQMQNAVRQRLEARGGASVEKPVLLHGTAGIQGATALKTEAAPSQAPQAGAVILENAVRNIEVSRQKFTVHEGSRKNPISPSPKGGARTFPIAAVGRSKTVPAPSPEPVDESRFKEIVPELIPATELHTDELPAIPKPVALAEPVAETVHAETEAEPFNLSPTVEEVAEALSKIEDFDEFDDVELVIDDEDLEIESAPVPVAEVKTRSTGRKAVSLPLFPEEGEQIETVSQHGALIFDSDTVTSEIHETVSETETAVLTEPEPDEVAEVSAVLNEVVVEQVAVEEVAEEDGLAEEYVEDIHKTTEPDVLDEEVVYEYGDEFSQGFIDDYEYEPRPETGEEEAEQHFEDVAPISMRFNAGLLDLLIGSGSSLLILSPFILSGGKWLSAPGLIAFAVTFAIVMFIYMTASIGFSGRTLGMKVLSLEMIDIEENEYPDFHQAALSSSLYLVSLALCGLGFVTAAFNPERRALHDLLSGTIIVREY